MEKNNTPSASSVPWETENTSKSSTSHLDRNGRQIEIGDRVKLILPGKMGTNYGEMTVMQLNGNWSVIVKKTGSHQVPAYMASHLEVVDD